MITLPRNLLNTLLMGFALKLLLLFLVLCTLATIVWLCVDFRRYLKRHSWLLLLLVSMDVCAQYTDKEGCEVAFRWGENVPGQLEQTKDGLCYRFIPSGKSWIIRLENQGNGDRYINWARARFMINAVSSALAFYGQPLSEEPLPVTCLKAGEQRDFEVTSASLVDEHRTRRIYSTSELKNDRLIGIHIVLSASDDGVRFNYNEFSFLVSKKIY